MRRSSLWMLPLTDGCVGVWAPRGYQRDRMRHAGKPPAAPVNRGSKAVPHGQRGASRAGGAQSPCSSDALARSRHGRRRCRYGGRRAAGRPPGRSQVSCKASLRCSSQRCDNALSQQVNCCANAENHLVGPASARPRRMSAGPPTVHRASARSRPASSDRRDALLKRRRSGPERRDAAQCLVRGCSRRALRHEWSQP